MLIVCRPIEHRTVLLRARGGRAQRVRQLAHGCNLALLHERPHWWRFEFGLGLGLDRTALECDGCRGGAHGGPVPAEHSGAPARTGGGVAALRALGAPGATGELDACSGEERVPSAAWLGLRPGRASPARAATLSIARPQVAPALHSQVCDCSPSIL